MRIWRFAFSHSCFCYFHTLVLRRSGGSIEGGARTYTYIHVHVMIQSPVSPESPEDRKYGARAFGRIHDYEAGLEVAAHQNREKIDLDPVVVLNQPEIPPVHDGHGRWREAPQVIDTTAPQAMGDAALEPTTPSAVTRSATVTSRDRDPSVAEKGPSEEAAKKEGKRVCGVGIKVFLLIVVLVILLVAAIVGGAVGGTLAKKSANSPYVLVFHAF